MKRLFFSIAFILLMMAISSISKAKVTGVCSNCHTMHNSQGGQPMARGDEPWGGGTGSGEAIPQLLIAGCLGCHSSTGSGTLVTFDGNKIPIVCNTGGYPSQPFQPLAGGNFYYVSLGGVENDAKGHNIFPDHGDSKLDKAPGDMDFANCVSNCCHANLHLPAGAHLGLTGKYGCEGCHLNVRHHADDHGHLEGGLVDSADQGWYRFLSGHMTGDGHGVEGYEDGDWQATTSPSDHNEYLGYQVSGGHGFVSLGHTTTAFCTGCHGVFHSEQGSENPWLRHPSDAVLPASGEYANYTIYDTLVPVARPSIPVPPDGNVYPGEDMVMCLSCHRAHGSPYFKLMRWDYKGWPGAGTNGCNVCHTWKD